MSDKANKAKVTVANFVRAETDNMFRANMNAFGMKIGTLFHLRKPPRRKTSQSFA